MYRWANADGKHHSRLLLSVQAESLLPVLGGDLLGGDLLGDCGLGEGGLGEGGDGLGEGGEGGDGDGTGGDLTGEGGYGGGYEGGELNSLTQEKVNDLTFLLAAITPAIEASRSLLVGHEDGVPEPLPQSRLPHLKC